MKLLFKVLWFDDQPSNVESFKKGIERILKTNGFRLDVVQHNSITNEKISRLSEDLRQYNPYDLIIFDHDLGSSGHGSDIALQLRRNIFTDMVYYSGTAVKTLREELYQKAIDGVFIVSRTDFVQNIQPIIEDHISRFTDMNNMRGLLLDAFSEFELRLRNRLKSKIEIMTPEQKDGILKKFTQKFDDRKQKIEKDKKEVSITNIHEKTFDFRNYDFNFIRTRLSQLEEECIIWQDHEALAEMQNLRNLLAHNTYTLDEDSRTVTIKAPNGIQKSFNSERFKEIRCNLLKIFDALDALPIIG